MNVEELLKNKLVKSLDQLGLEVLVNDIVIENSKNPLHGDYASNVALKFASKMKMKPFDLANKIIEVIDKDGLEKIEIAGPGFMNFFLKKDSLNSLINKIIDEDKDFGRSDRKNLKVNVEFVSANPTGDLHLGHARIAAFGDSLCRILDFAGYDVTREYYLNDAGNQIHTLGLSLNIRYHQLHGEKVELPLDSYHAEDIVDIAKEFDALYGDKYLTDTASNLEFITQFGVEKELDKIKRDLDNYRVNFDVLTKESDIRKNHHVEDVLNNLYKNYTYVDDGGTFLRTTAFLDDKDRCVVKRDGSFTYMMPDIAYHLNKLSRGFDYLIDVLGADHHGYINRMKSALMMQGYKEDTLEVELIQIVRLIKDGEEVKMSKRTGAGVSLKELCDEVGVDAVRYFFVSRAGSAHLDFDLNLALEHNSSNPVYYAQYAHARLSKVLDLAKDIPLDKEGKHLSNQYEIDLLKCLLEFNKVVANAASKRAPNLIVNYIQELSALIHSFYTQCRLIDKDNLEVTSSRLALVKAAKIVISNALNLIGVSSPSHM